MSEQIVRIELKLLAPEYRALAKIADSKGVNAHTLIEEMVRRSLAPAQTRILPKPQLLEAIVRLHERGYNDREIADRLGENKERIRSHRNRLHLPANDARGRIPNTNQEEIK